jgi:hypothetical protein
MTERATDIPDFRDFLIETSKEVYGSATTENPNLNTAMLINALHFMQEVELVHAAEVDHTQQEPGASGEHEYVEFCSLNKRRGNLINCIWRQIKIGNGPLIEGVSQLELEHAEDYGLSDLPANSIHDIGRPAERLYALEQYASQRLPMVYIDGVIDGN